MKQKKIFALTLVLALLIGIFAMVPSASAVSDRPVKLIYAKPGHTSSGVTATGYVEVENIAYNKSVTIHYSFDGTDWLDCAAEYYKPTWGNYEAWKFETTGKPALLSQVGIVTIQFAIKYEVNGQTYWDNNNGNNYFVKVNKYLPDQFDFGVGGVANYYANVYNGATEGYLQLKDLGDSKDVKVIYTTDNWSTSNQVNAQEQYSFYQSEVEMWEFTLPTTSSNLKYKLSYTVNGTTYVDDNFGNYYTV